MLALSLIEIWFWYFDRDQGSAITFVKIQKYVMLNRTLQGHFDAPNSIAI